jgi:hypothetical protein
MVDRMREADADRPWRWLCSARVDESADGSSPRDRHDS